MLNMIKMDLYRMVRTKSMYVVWIVMAAAIFFSTSMSKLDIDTMNKEAEQQQTENIAETVKPETINMGMSVFLPTQPGEKVTVFDQVYANLQAKFICLCMNTMIVLYGVINHLIQKAGVENFQILKYTVTGKIALLSMSPTNKECLTAVVIAAAFGIVVTLLTAWVFRKRDI